MEKVIYGIVTFLILLLLIRASYVVMEACTIYK